MLNEARINNQRIGAQQEASTDKQPVYSMLLSTGASADEEF
jgi:hypothetical protein